MGFLSDIVNGLFGSGGDNIGGIGQGPNATGFESQAHNLLAQRQGILNQAYGRALQTTAGIGAANAQQIRDNAAQSAGGLLGRLTSSGLSNTSVAPNLARGIVADQNRQLLSNNANVSSLLSGLYVGQGQAEAGALGALAQNLVGRGERDRAFFLNRSGLQLRRDTAAAGLDQQSSAALGSGVGSILGFGLGGGFA